MGWTQPLCTNCWMRENSVPTGDGLSVRVPTRVKQDDREWGDLLEICCLCGQATTSQIFIRRDPETVPYPREEESSNG